MNPLSNDNDINIDILYEDSHLIAINKKPSQIVQGDKTGDIPLDQIVKNYLKKKYRKLGKVFIGIIHRLDRPVSGVLLFARTSKALSRMNEMFRDNQVRKSYWTIVKEKPPKKAGLLEHYLKKNEKQNKSYAYNNKVKGSKLASMKYRLLNKSDLYFLLEVELLTGRHHQIRCQLAKIGCPVKGDLKYGFPRSNSNGSISLHARQISFIHPVKKNPLTIIAPVPDDKLWIELTRTITASVS